MLLKTVYQWDIDSGENLATFQEESLEIDRQVERIICRRSDNIAPGRILEMTEIISNAETGDREVTERYRNDDTGIPFMSREKFIGQISRDLDEGCQFEDDEFYGVYNGFNSDCLYGRNIPREIVVRAVVEHRDGKPVRAEFLEVRGSLLAGLPDPNAGGILGIHHGEYEDRGLVVEGQNGQLRVDRNIDSRLSRFCKDASSTSEDNQASRDAAKRLTRRDLDNRDAELARYLLEEARYG